MNLYAGGFEEEIRNHFYAASQALGIDVLFVYGRSIDPSSLDNSAHNRIFDRLSANRIDAYVYISTSLSALCGTETFYQYIQRFQGLPQVSIGLAIPSIPSIIVNGRKAMTELVEHLIVGHGRRRIAYISGIPGNAESESRLAAYLNVLERFNLARFPDFLADGYFSRDRGERAMVELIERNIDFDAVVCANDTMAFGAYDALRRANRLIPHDVSVTGFDDVLTSRICSPPLSTITQPFADLASTAIRLVLRQMASKAVPELVSLDATVVLRASCGCNTLVPFTNRDDTNIASNLQLSTDNDLPDAQLIQVTAAALEDSFRPPDETATRLVSALVDELKHHNGGFLSALEHIIQQSPGDGMRILALQQAISRLRIELLPLRTLELENLWHSARDILSIAASAGHVQHTLELHAVTLNLQCSSDRLADALDLSELTRSIATSLHVLGFPSARVTRFADCDGSKSAHLLNVVNGHSMAPPPANLPSLELFAPNFETAQTAYAGVVFPLTFEGQLHGIIAFGYSPSVRGYQLLRDQVAAALRNVTKHEALLERTREHERLTQERAATAKRLESLSVLAGSVAHDLNNALGPVGLLLEMMVSEIKCVPLETYPNLATVLDDAETIRQSIHQSAQIVLDLLTLGRQGRALKQRVDLTSVVKRACESESAYLSRHDGPRIVLLTDYATEPVFVRGAEVQLTRVIVNLIRNAIDASEHGGSITLSTERRHLTVHAHVYETIPPGEYAVLTVSDQGCGIDAAELDRVFEPYYSSKHANDRSGTGLGLAIVHAVVKDHEGYVDVESTVGVGTTFRIFLPCARYGF
jgi:signal transduction histidine kinase/DNA-binding LacI/PurR family transcriptional regulator